MIQVDTQGNFVIVKISSEQGSVNLQLSPTAALQLGEELASKACLIVATAVLDQPEKETIKLDGGGVEGFMEEINVLVSDATKNLKKK